MKDFRLRQILVNDLWLPVAAALVATLLLPIVLGRFSHSQSLDINGNHLREGNRVVDKFMSEIRAENGVLILGTSETANSLEDSNYWILLNKDQNRKQKYSVLAGAGRTCGTYIPIMIAKKASFQKQRILLYINPTYWRLGLDQFRADYFERYVGPRLYKSIEKEAKHLGVYYGIMDQAVFNSTLGDTLQTGSTANIALAFDNFRSYFYYDLARYFLPENEYIKQSNDFVLDTSQISASKAMHELTKDLDLGYNVLQRIVNDKVPFPEVDPSATYRYRQLEAFIRLCKANDVDLTVYLGPYNAIYCDRVNPEFHDEYESVLSSVRGIVIAYDVKFIDGSNLSYIPGTFLDIQHISKYGAYLTAQQIKKHYETD